MQSKSDGALTLGTKAETLARLEAILRKSVVPTSIYFTVREWQADAGGVLDRVRSLFGSGRVIVRSSALTEDSASTAMAGAFLSISNIRGNDRDGLMTAIESVAASYHRFSETANLENQILVQQFVANVSMSGVLFTQDLNTGAPYYVINYDDQSGRTDTVASGQCNRTLLVHRGSSSRLKSRRFEVLIESVAEIEAVTKNQNIDIEFAVDESQTVFIFQVRPITTIANWNRAISVKVTQAIERCAQLANERMSAASGLYGSSSILGRMPDWNPAEMIGSCPRPLAASLYQRLITDSAWRVARSELGYSQPAGMPLLILLYGQPFIDVRLSFHSFVPKNLPEVIATKLVDAWLLRLAENPHLHDKVEFEVAITALDFSFDYLVEKLMPDVLTNDELATYKASLHNLTRDILSETHVSIDEQLEKVHLLLGEVKRLASMLDSNSLALVRSLLEICVELGTVPFSILARQAFIAQSILNSLVTREILSAEDVDRFHGSFPTITSDLINDLRAVSIGCMDQQHFLESYGHLRPGTYDILSVRYDQRDSLFDKNLAPFKPPPTYEKFALTAEKRQKIKALLKTEKLGVSVDQLFLFCEKAIKAREYSKFIFSRSVSDALCAIERWGQSTGLSIEEVSFLSIQDILDSQAKATGRDKEQQLRALSVANRNEYEVSKALRLPHLIRDESDLFVVPLLLDHPNFITRKSVKGKREIIQGADTDPPSIDGKIVVIESADPGFDWIFTRNIIGLVTKFGGMNSHMAIRCAEFDLPAAIGCGEQIFEQVIRSTTIEIQCAEGRVIALL